LHSKTIEKKKESYLHLTNNKKIPRSLRIKVELSTSPSFSTNDKFIHLREKLRQKVQDFIHSSTEIMTEWAEENVQLLLNERCCSILTKALPILDGLTSYNADIIHSPKWISNSSRKNMLYMFLIYMSTDLINISKIIGYFKLPIDTICLIGDKILTNNNSDNSLPIP
jgi:hypothetical protein